MYAIVKTGGKQYRVEKGQTLLVERLPAAEGETVTLQLLDWGQVEGHVCWVRDGKIGINFAAALE